MSAIAQMSLLLISVLCSQIALGDSILVWERTAGLHSEGREVKKTKPKKIDLDKYRKARQSLFDIHTEEVKVYRVIPLPKILQDYPSDRNLILLHFDNGMIIPLSTQIKRDYIYDPQKVVIATAVQKDKKWSKKFAANERKGLSKYEKDPAPTPVVGNKPIPVFPKEYFYYVDAKGVKWLKFTPWAHSNGLKGIEFVDHDAYYRQFDISPTQQKGFVVYQNRCQFCHGMQMVGASYGWDYVDPVKVAAKRDAVNIHMFVKYPKLQPFMSKMPNQLDFTEAEAKEVWNWLDDISKKKVAPYRL